MCEGAGGPFANPKSLFDRAQLDLNTTTVPAGEPRYWMGLTFTMPSMLGPV